MRKSVMDVIREYQKSYRRPSSLTIATLARHSCKQILCAAKMAGFRTLAIANSSIPEEADYYRQFGYIDEVREIQNWNDFFGLEEELIRRMAVLVPTGSFVAYLHDDREGREKMKRMRVPYFGNRAVLDWEADRMKQRQWLADNANILMPPLVEHPEKIDKPVIVKFYGAEGGKGYFVAETTEEFYRELARYTEQFGERTYLLEEYIVGNPLYFHLYASPFVDGHVRLTGTDRRYESNADSLGRIPARRQYSMDVQPSFTVVGNFTMKPRESLEPRVWGMAKRAVAASRLLVSERGLWGPFCLETVIDERGAMHVIEISARIVAGSNVVPFPALAPNDPWWERGDDAPDTFLEIPPALLIARNIRRAVKEMRLTEVLD